MRREHGLTLRELLVLVAILAPTTIFVVMAAQRSSAINGRRRCRNNLNQLAKGMATYFHMQHYPTYYPCPLSCGRTPNEYGGAEWLASLYWEGYVPDPGVFLCPSSGDTNADGVHLGETRAGAQFGSQSVSYAGLHWRSATASGSPIRGDEWLPSDVMASDDTEGTINHTGWYNRGVCVAFLDCHVEWKTANELDPATAVGQKGGLLEKLRN